MPEQETQQQPVTSPVLTQIRELESQKVRTDADRAAKAQAMARLVRQLHAENSSKKNEILNGDPAYRYCWVYNSDQTINQRLGLGWTVVDGADPAKTAWKKDDGTHKRGDAILMRASRDLIEAQEWVEAQKAREAVEDHNAGVEGLEEATNGGIRITESRRRL